MGEKLNENDDDCISNIFNIEGKKEDGLKQYTKKYA